METDSNFLINFALKCHLLESKSVLILPITIVTEHLLQCMKQYAEHLSPVCSLLSPGGETCGAECLVWGCCRVLDIYRCAYALDNVTFADVPRAAMLISSWES